MKNYEKLMSDRFRHSSLSFRTLIHNIPPSLIGNLHPKEFQFTTFRRSGQMMSNVCPWVTGLPPSPARILRPAQQNPWKYRPFADRHFVDGIQKKNSLFTSWSKTGSSIFLVGMFLFMWWYYRILLILAASELHEVRLLYRIGLRGGVPVVTSQNPF